MDKMREEFECWADGQGYNRDRYVADDCGDVYKHLVGQYVISETRLLWKAWKASRAALCVELPKTPYFSASDEPDLAFEYGVEVMKDLIESAGVTCK